MLFLVLCLSSEIGEASYISLSPQLDIPPIILHKHFEVNFSLVNLGDEAAYDVNIKLLYPPCIKIEPLKLGTLSPNIPFHGVLKFYTENNTKPGVYTLVLLLGYRDKNAYPFSNIVASLLNLNSSSKSKLEVRVMPLNLTPKESGKLRVNLTNLDIYQHKITLRLHLPNELSSTIKERKVEVEGGTTYSTYFDISSKNALSGSSYVVVVSAEYEEDGIHDCTFGFTTVSIEGEEEYQNYEKLSLYPNEWVAKGVRVISQLHLPRGFVFKMFILTLILFVILQFKK